VSTSWSLSHSVHRAGRQSRLPFSVAGGVTKMLRAERVLWLPPRQGRAPQRTGGEAVQPRHQQASAFCFASAGASRRYRYRLRVVQLGSCPAGNSRRLLQSCIYVRAQESLLACFAFQVGKKCPHGTPRPVTDVPAAEGCQRSNLRKDDPLNSYHLN